MPRPQQTGHDTAASPLTTPIEVDREVIVRLRGEAARRQTTTTRLICDLLEAIVEDRLTAAILDR